MRKPKYHHHLSAVLITFPGHAAHHFNQSQKQKRKKLNIFLNCSVHIRQFIFNQFKLGSFINGNRILRKNQKLGPLKIEFFYS